MKKIYKFKIPLNGEDNERFEVIEKGRDKWLVREIAECAKWPIKPTYWYFKDDLIEVKN